MKKIKIALAALLCFYLCLPVGGEADDAPVTPDKRTSEGLTAWFCGKTDDAEKIFSALEAENTSDPVPSHALALMLSDRSEDYPRVTQLYNRHSFLSVSGQEYYRAVSPLLEEYAAKGVVQAQLMLARTLQWGIEKYEPGKAMLLLRRAADGGYSQAQRELGVLYQDGTGVEQNFARARQLYSAAALQGDAFAMKNLAVMLINAQGSTESDRAKALELLHSADAMNLPDAQTVLAQMYVKGIYVQRDVAEGCEWYKKAADNGSVDAMMALAELYERGEGVEQSPQQSLEWTKKAADCGNANALFRLGVLYYEGRSVEADHEQAFNYFKSAAERGNPTAWYNVGFLSRKGDGTPQNFAEALTWFKRAAEFGSHWAQISLGVMYANGEGTEPDFEEATFWIELSALSNNPDAPQLLAQLADKTDDAAKDRAKRRAETTFKRINSRKQPAE